MVKQIISAWTAAFVTYIDTSQKDCLHLPKDSDFHIFKDFFDFLSVFNYLVFCREYITGQPE